MASLIHELENNEALLLMFLSGELPVDDRTEVEQMLAADANLRAELAQIQSAHDSAMNVLAKLDQDQTQIPAENHAIRQAMRAMKQWQVNRLARQPVFVPPARHKIPYWVYPIASVAALLIATIAWWGFGGQFHSPTGSSVTPPVAFGDGSGGFNLPDNYPSAPPTLAQSSDEVTATRLSNSLSNDVPSSESSNTIAEAENQASVLVARSDGSTVTSEIALAEANP